jgi:hypothetical protein
LRRLPPRSPRQRYLWKMLIPRRQCERFTRRPTFSTMSGIQLHHRLRLAARFAYGRPGHAEAGGIITTRAASAGNTAAVSSASKPRGERSAPPSQPNLLN